MLAAKWPDRTRVVDGAPWTSRGLCGPSAAMPQAAAAEGGGIHSPEPAPAAAWTPSQVRDACPELNAPAFGTPQCMVQATDSQIQASPDRGQGCTRVSVEDDQSTVTHKVLFSQNDQGDDWHINSDRRRKRRRQIGDSRERFACLWDC